MSSISIQNTINYQLPTNNLPFIFQHKLFTRELNPIVKNKARTLTIKCTQPHCK